jgi:hypothetical protein
MNMSKFPDKADLIKVRVLRLLAEEPDTRNNDMLLAWLYWAKFDEPQLNDVIYILSRKKIMYGLTNYESIRRIRQKIMEGPDGKFKPGPDVISSRMRKQKEMLEWVHSQQRE